MINNFHTLCLTLLLGLMACQSPQSPTTPTRVLNAQDVQRVVLLGGTLISGMEDHGFFEQAILHHYADNKVSFRNIGWPADDVFGLARSQFGSAQNTRSWQPPTAEEGYGSKVLMEHITASSPRTLMIGYGSEVAYASSEADFELFQSGYLRLLDFAENSGARLILLSPPKQEKGFVPQDELNQRNAWLEKTHVFVKEQAQKRNHHFIDLFSTLISDTDSLHYTENGVQLTPKGYQRMSELLLSQLGLDAIDGFVVDLGPDASLANCHHCGVSNWQKTVNGVSFYLTPEKMLHSGQIQTHEPVAIYINGRLATKKLDTLASISLVEDSIRQARLNSTLKEKNRLHRYRLRPLNEAYIYLFRRHEMGHLAYEMDDLDKLVKEKEAELQELVSNNTYFVEVELARPWKAPKNYPEDEVPAFIPEPNIEAELEAFQVQTGFEVSLFAADPMITNPININWDTQGRAWVATSSTYPHIVPGKEPNDKIIILEDTDQDGVADTHTVFAENLLVPHSVMPVPGGAYVAATTELLFFEDTDGDDVADKRRVVYDGFGNADVHHMIHGLRWMPWGDLHFTQSIYINSFVETPYGIRILNGSGIWAFQPETERLEVFSRGLINPWGEALDQWGQTFATDGAGSSGINYLFPESAHATAVGAPQVLPGLNSNTPKNTAAEVIYSRHFPSDWQGSIITHDFRANRTVRYAVAPKESGYAAQELETVLRSDHRSYRPVDSKIGPDGALYIVDWYNPIIDHGEVDFHHPIRDRSHGRIWKLSHKGSPLLKPIDFQEQSLKQLLELLKAPEQFTRLLANRAFVEKQGDPQLVVQWITGLDPRSRRFSQHRLEGLWLLTALHYQDESILTACLNSPLAQERAAAIRILGQWGKPGNFKDLLMQRIQDKHPQVRLESLHALRKMGGMDAAEMATTVLDYPQDENITFALDLTLRSTQEAWLPQFTGNNKPFGGEVNKQLYALLTTEDSRIIGPVTSILQQPKLDPVLAEKAWHKLAKIGDAQTRQRVLEYIQETGTASLLRTLVQAPEAYDAVPQNIQALGSLLTHENGVVRIEALKLAGRWQALAFSKTIAAHINRIEDPREKLEAFRALMNMGKTDQVIQAAKTDSKEINRVIATQVWVETDPASAVNHAVQLMASLDDPTLAEGIFVTFRRLEKGPEILRNALQGKKLPEETASLGLQVIQSSGLNLAALDSALRQAGSIQAVGISLSENEQAQLIQEALANGNRYRGRQIYRRKELLCATCHKIDGIGGLIGPDLSTIGSYMTPNSILESILNPSSDIKQNYETVLITRKDGEVVSGLLHRKTNTSTLVRQPSGEIREIPAQEIEKVDVSAVSLMPGGLTQNLHRDELKDLLAFLVNLGKEN